MFVKNRYCDLKFMCIHIKIMVSIFIKENNVMGKHGLFKLMVTAAAIGGVCYAFRDKIKETKVYKSLDVEDKVEKAKRTIKEKIDSKDDKDRDYFTLNDEKEDNPSEDTDTQAENEEAATVDEASEDITAKVNNLLSDIPEINISESELTPDVQAENEEAATADEASEEETPIIYENEGLSDTSEDLDVIEEQDRLDI